MSWTSPMTAVSGSFTAAQWNTHIRDNLNATSPALAANAGSWFVSTGANAIAERKILANSVAALQTTTSTTYTDLTTAGPAVTLTTGTQAIVSIYAYQGNTVDDVGAACTFAVSGATTVAVSENYRLLTDGLSGATTTGTGDNMLRIGRSVLLTGLTSGSNTFTMKYKVTSSGTGVFGDRRIIVMAL